MTKLYEFARNCLSVGGPDNTQRAMSTLLSLAEDDMPRAQAKLAFLYSSGYPIERDESKAFYWTKKAADQNYPLSVSSLANYYWVGLAVDKDREKAMELYTKAADLGDDYSCWMLGEIYSGTKPVFTGRNGDTLYVSFLTEKSNEYLLILYQVSTKEAGWKLYTDIEVEHIEILVNNILMGNCSDGLYWNDPDELLKAKEEIEAVKTSRATAVDPVSADTEMQEREETTSEQNRVVFQSNGIIMSLDTIEMEYNPVFDSYTLYFTVNAENNGDFPALICFETITLNGYETRCLWGFRVGIGKKAREKVTLFDIDESTGLVNADDLETVEFDCYIADSDTYKTITEHLGVGNVIKLK